MGGEHLPISNYDELTAEEIGDKLDLLTQNNPNVDLASVREYEEGAENRKAVLEKLDKLENQTTTEEVVGSEPTATPQGKSQPGPTPGADKKES
jgi:hypothetical protein